MNERRLGRFQQIITFLLDSRKDIEVFGMFGAANLGDEAMLVAAQETLPTGRAVGCRAASRYPFVQHMLHARWRPTLLVAGGTLIHGGDTGWLDYVENRAEQGSQVVFCGTGIAFNEDQLTDHYPPYKRWSRLLSASPQVHLRGPRSVDVAQRMGATADIFGDFAFLLHDPDLVRTDHARRDDIIGLNFGYCLADQEAFETAAVKLIQCLPPKSRLVYHVVVPKDIIPTQRIIAKAGIAPERYKIEHHYYDPRAFMASIKNYRAFFGLKLHAAGLAMIAGVPSLMISYLPKCRDFMAPLGGDGDFLIDLPLDVACAMDKIQALLDHPETDPLEPTIADYAMRQRQILARMFPTR